MTVHAAARTTRSTRSNGSTGWVPFDLVAALVVVPAIAGSLRLVALAGGAHLLPANARLTASPVPLVVHIVSALAYALLGTSELTTDLCLGAGCVINLAVAEYVIRRSARRRAIIGRPTITSRSIRATAKVRSS